MLVRTAQAATATQPGPYNTIRTASKPDHRAMTRSDSDYSSASDYKYFCHRTTTSRYILNIPMQLVVEASGTAAAAPANPSETSPLLKPTKAKLGDVRPMRYRTSRSLSAMHVCDTPQGSR